MKARNYGTRDASSIARGLLSVVSLAQSEAQRAMMAMERRGLPPELGGGAREEWQGEAENDGAGPLNDGVTTYDVGMYQAIATSALQLLRTLDLGDREQIVEIRTLFGIMQQLCRERLSAQPNPKSIAARGWRYLGNQLVEGLKHIAVIDRVLPGIRPPDAGGRGRHPDRHFRGQQFPHQNGDFV